MTVDFYGIFIPFYLIGLNLQKNIAKFLEDVSCVKSFFSLANDTKQTKSIINNACTCTYKNIVESNSEKKYTSVK